MRIRVREHLLKNLEPKSTILEINCGSGIDAVYFSKKGYVVHATDAAKGMLVYVESKIISEKLKDNLTCELLSFEKLNTLEGNKYNNVFSNFGGLNCISLSALKSVINSFEELLEPEGRVTLVIMPKICIWELLKVFKGNKQAFRRVSNKTVLANVEGEEVPTYYHSAKQVKSFLSPNFTDFKVENICFFAPTGDRVDFPERHPMLFRFLSSLDRLSNKIPFLQGYGDYYIISAKKKIKK